MKYVARNASVSREMSVFDTSKECGSGQGVTSVTFGQEARHLLHLAAGQGRNVKIKD